MPEQQELIFTEPVILCNATVPKALRKLSPLDWVMIETGIFKVYSENGFGETIIK